MLLGVVIKKKNYKFVRINYYETCLLSTKNLKIGRC